MKLPEQANTLYRDRFADVVDLIRIYVGIGLTIRGILYIDAEGRSVLFDQVNGIGFSWAIPYILGHYIILAHAVGGIFLALGILTRWMAAIQLPILLGAVILVHPKEGLLSSGQGMEFSLLVLVLLGLLTWCGPGRLSMDVSVFQRVRPPDAAKLDP